MQSNNLRHVVCCLQKNPDYGRPLSKKDLSRSQMDLAYDVDSMEDNRSLSGLSIGSKGSSRGSEEAPVGPQDISLSKSNKGMR